jgi:tetratricopeptide (TPR) repeat protein/NAD-dependent SIR2 family protein deacetylase
MCIFAQIIVKKMAAYNDIINLLLNNKIAVLSGAGISYDSGLPVVSAFYQHFLPMFYMKDDAEYLMGTINNEHIPFERMMEHIFNYTGNDNAIMDIFANGEPNIVHEILALMLTNGLANELYTTNFDCLIEKSLEKSGLIKRKNYGYFFDEKGFSKLKKTDFSIKNLIKIHGTIDHKDSIRTTLETITSTKLLSSRKPAIERLFSTGIHDVILVLGYSFSDIFDINKYIKELEVSKKIIVINHTQNADIIVEPLTSLNKDGNKNPFLTKNVNGCVVTVNTLSFMSKLCMIKYGSIPDANPIIYDWKSYLDRWVAKFDASHKAYIAGGICNAMTEYNIGSKYNTKAFETVNSNETELYVSVINNHVLSIFRTRKDQTTCENLVTLCNNAIKLLENNRQNVPEKFYLKRLDDLNYRLGRIYEDGYFDYEKAIRYYFTSYRLAYKNNDILGMSQTLHEIGETYASLGNVTSAIKSFKKSIKLKRKCGYIGGITRTYYTMAATIYSNDRKKIKQAETCLNRAEETVKVVGETDLIFYIRNLRGVIFMEKQQWGIASKLFENNILSLENNPRRDIVSLSTANYNMARCEIRLKKYCSAISRLEKNLKTVSDLGSKQRIYRNSQELAIAYLLEGNGTKCYQHLSSNTGSLYPATNADKGHFFFYVALYYKYYNLKKEYKEYLNTSKLCFQANNTVKEFYSLKRDLDKEVNADTTLILSKDKYITTLPLPSLKQ